MFCFILAVIHRPPFSPFFAFSSFCLFCFLQQFVRISANIQSFSVTKVMSPDLVAMFWCPVASEGLIIEMSIINFSVCSISVGV